MTVPPSGSGDELDETIIIEANGQKIPCRRNRFLLNELLNAGLVVSTACGGKGNCHLCRVTILDKGAISAPNKTEVKALGNVLIAQGMRLSCQIQVVAPFAVSLPKVESPDERRERIRRAREKKNRS